MLPMYKVRDSVFKYQKRPNQGMLAKPKPHAAENTAAANVVPITIRLGPIRSLNAPGCASTFI
jgi:hypothetical protein